MVCFSHSDVCISEIVGQGSSGESRENESQSVAVLSFEGTQEVTCFWTEST